MKTRKSLISASGLLLILATVTTCTQTAEDETTTTLTHAVISNNTTTGPSVIEDMLLEDSNTETNIDLKLENSTNNSSDISTGIVSISNEDFLHNIEITQDNSDIDMSTFSNDDLTILDLSNLADTSDDTLELINSGNKSNNSNNSSIVNQTNLSDLEDESTLDETFDFLNAHADNNTKEDVSIVSVTTFNVVTSRSYISSKNMQEVPIESDDVFESTEGYYSSTFDDSFNASMEDIFRSVVGAGGNTESSLDGDMPKEFGIIDTWLQEKRNDRKNNGRKDEEGNLSDDNQEKRNKDRTLSEVDEKSNLSDDNQEKEIEDRNLSSDVGKVGITGYNEESSKGNLEFESTTRKVNNIDAIFDTTVINTTPYTTSTSTETITLDLENNDLNLADRLSDENDFIVVPLTEKTIELTTIKAVTTQTTTDINNKDISNSTDPNLSTLFTSNLVVNNSFESTTELFLDLTKSEDDMLVKSTTDLNIDESITDLNIGEIITDLNIDEVTTSLHIETISTVIEDADSLKITPKDNLENVPEASTVNLGTTEFVSTKLDDFIVASTTDFISTVSDSNFDTTALENNTTFVTTTKINDDINLSSESTTEQIISTTMLSDKLLEVVPINKDNKKELFSIKLDLLNPELNSKENIDENKSDVSLQENIFFKVVPISEDDKEINSKADTDLVWNFPTTESVISTTQNSNNIPTVITNPIVTSTTTENIINLHELKVVPFIDVSQEKFDNVEVINATNLDSDVDTVKENIDGILLSTISSGVFTNSLMTNDVTTEALKTTESVVHIIDDLMLKVVNLEDIVDENDLIIKDLTVTTTDLNNSDLSSTTSATTEYVELKEEIVVGDENLQVVAIDNFTENDLITSTATELITITNDEVHKDEVNKDEVNKDEVNKDVVPLEITKEIKEDSQSNIENFNSTDGTYIKTTTETHDFIIEKSTSRYVNTALDSDEIFNENKELINKIIEDYENDKEESLRKDLNKIMLIGDYDSTEDNDKDDKIDKQGNKEESRENDENREENMDKLINRSHEEFDENVALQKFDDKHNHASNTENKNNNETSTNDKNSEDNTYDDLEEDFFAHHVEDNGEYSEEQDGEESVPIPTIVEVPIVEKLAEELGVDLQEKLRLDEKIELDIKAIQNNNAELENNNKNKDFNEGSKDDDLDEAIEDMKDVDEVIETIKDVIDGKIIGEAIMKSKKDDYKTEEKDREMVDSPIEDVKDEYDPIKDLVYDNPNELGMSEELIEQAFKTNKFKELNKDFKDVEVNRKDIHTIFRKVNIGSSSEDFITVNFSMQIIFDTIEFYIPDDVTVSANKSDQFFYLNLHWITKDSNGANSVIFKMEKTFDSLAIDGVILDLSLAGENSDEFREHLQLEKYGLNILEWSKLTGYEVSFDNGNSLHIVYMDLVVNENIDMDNISDTDFATMDESLTNKMTLIIIIACSSCTIFMFLLGFLLYRKFRSKENVFKVALA